MLYIEPPFLHGWSRYMYLKSKINLGLTRFIRILNSCKNSKTEGKRGNNDVTKSVRFFLSHFFFYKKKIEPDRTVNTHDRLGLRHDRTVYTHGTIGLMHDKIG